MKILAIDTTAKTATAALTEDEKLIGLTILNTPNTHSVTLLPAIEGLLNGASVTAGDIDLFVCSAGPGSFTGVRIGTSTVKGLAYAQNKTCIGISALEALAENITADNCVICPVMDARRGQLYNALFLCEGGKLTRLCEDRLISVFDLEEELKKYTDKKIYLCGDGYDIAKGAFEAVKTEDTPTILQYQSAYSVALCALEAAERKLLTTDVELSPIYLRASQAERERLERLEKESEAQK